VRVFKGLRGGGPFPIHYFNETQLIQGFLLVEAGYRAQKLDKHNVVTQDIPGGGEVALRAVVDLAEKRLEYQLVKHTFV